MQAAFMHGLRGRYKSTAEEHGNVSVCFSISLASPLIRRIIDSDMAFKALLALLTVTSAVLAAPQDVTAANKVSCGGGRVAGHAQVSCPHLHWPRC